MICDLYKATVPFVARTVELQEGLPNNIHNSELMFNSWFLSMKKMGTRVSMLCPDILYLINEDDTGPEPSKEDWKEFSKTHEILGISTYAPNKLIHSFSCQEIGLKCRPWADMRKNFLNPWCCNQHYSFMMRKFEEVSEKLGFHYSIEDGTLIGALKLNNFIPWDVDGDARCGQICL